jgi:hypothetical protein
MGIAAQRSLADAGGAGQSLQVQLPGTGAGLTQGFFFRPDEFSERFSELRGHGIAIAGECLRQAQANKQLLESLPRCVVGGRLGRLRIRLFFYPMLIRAPGGRSKLCALRSPHRWRRRAHLCGSFRDLFFGLASAGARHQLRDQDPFAAPLLPHLTARLRKIAAKFGVGGVGPRLPGS